MNESSIDTSFDTMQLVIYLYAKGESYRNIAVPLSAVTDIVKMYIHKDRLELHYSAGYQDY